MEQHKVHQLDKELDLDQLEYKISLLSERGLCISTSSLLFPAEYNRKKLSNQPLIKDYRIL